MTRDRAAERAASAARDAVASRELAHVLRLQHGVVSRVQILAAGYAPGDLERLQRRHRLVRVLPGVFVDHTGQLSWEQRAMAGVLHFDPAAVGGHGAMRLATSAAWRHVEERAPIELVVPASRHLLPTDGYVFTRTRHYATRVLTTHPPARIRPEHAVLDLAERAMASGEELTAIGFLADACQSRRTTAGRILAALESRPELTGRAFLRSVLVDVDAGTCSALEHAYLARVERPHGLPEGRRQPSQRTPGGLTRSVYRDVDYDPIPALVELDSTLFHNTAVQRDKDLDRDLDAVVDAASGPRTTVRLGWGQAVQRPCHTAVRLGLLFRALGWDGETRPCPDCEARAA